MRSVHAYMLAKSSLVNEGLDQSVNALTLNRAFGTLFLCVDTIEPAKGLIEGGWSNFETSKRRTVVIRFIFCFYTARL